MQIVTSWMQEGLKQGRVQGRVQGRQQEALSLVLRQLNRRVGAVPEELEARLDRLSVSELEDLGEALLEFSKLSDLEAWLGEWDQSERRR